MERWNGTTKKRVENEKIDAFLAEIRRVCVEHNMSIAPEDSHGGFEITRFDPDLMTLLEIAVDYTDEVV